MKEKVSGLSMKLIIGILLLSILLCTAISYMGYRAFTTVLEDEYNRSAYEIAETAKTYLDADRLEYYLETGDVDEAYLEIQKQLDALTVSTNSYLIYVTRLSDDYTTSTYIFDSVHPDTGFSRYELGYTAKDMDPYYQEEVAKMMTTGENSAVYFYSYSDASGAHTTAAIPLADSRGKIVALLGVEKAMTALEEARLSYVWNVLRITVLAVALFLLLYIFFLRSQVISPILTIAGETRRFAENGEARTDLLNHIHKKDEIGILAKAISKMEADIVKYVENLTAVTAEKERIGAELNVATQIQADMLPRIFPPFPERDEFDIYATMIPAREVGGDFYDFFLVDDDHLAIVIADVSGKGVPAALFMVIAKTLIKNHAQSGMAPGKVFETVNNQLCDNNEAGMFVTAFFGVLEISTGRFTYVNAGHNPPLVSQGGQPYEWLQSKRGFVLAGMEDMRYSQQEIMLHPGDRVFFYTDGITEALNPNNEFYSEARLKAFFNRVEDGPLEEQLALLQQDIATFADKAEQADDITMLLLGINRMQADKLTVTATMENLDRVLAFVNEKLDGPSSSAKLVSQVDMAVEEIFVNIARYAYQPEEGDVSICCKTESDPFRLTITFTDSGHPFNPLEKEDPDVTQDATERQVGGLGIYMAKKLMDGMEYEYRDGKNILTLRKSAGAN